MATALLIGLLTIIVGLLLFELWLIYCAYVLDQFFGCGG